MKFLIFIYCIFLSFNLSLGQYSYNYHHIKGKVKYCIEHQYETIKKSERLIISEYFGKTTFEYDINGNLVEESIYGRYKKKNKWQYWFSNKIIFEYNSKNLLIKQTHVGADHTINRKINYEYDDKNLMIKMTKIDGNIIYEHGFKYYFNKDGKPIHRYDYQYNRLDGYAEFEYDKIGNLSKEIFFSEYQNADSIFTDTMEIYSYEYKNQGKLSLKKSTSLWQGTTNIEIYDKDGNRITWIQNWDNGNIGNSIAQYKYLINKKGNWIKQYFSDTDQKNKTFLNQREYIYH